MRYSIEDTTLTALGDATRKIVGETRWAYKEKEVLGVENYTIPNSYVIINSNFEVPNAKYVKVKIIIPSDRVYYVAATDIRKSDNVAVNSKEFEFDSNNEGLVSIEDFYGGLIKIQVNSYSGTITYSIEVYFYDADMNLIQLPDEEVKNTLTPLQMAEELNKAPLPPTAEELIVTGACTQYFSYNNWNWFIEKYGDKIITKDITQA